jgi:hypothetical protein
MAISCRTPGRHDDWKDTDANDPTKICASTILSNERDALHDKDSFWQKEMAMVADEGDPVWKKGITEATTSLAASKPFVQDGLGVKFKHTSEGPTTLMPIFAKGVDQSTNDQFPGEQSKAMSMMLDDTVARDHAFEGAVVAPIRFFGDSFKKHAPNRASGGPWIEVPVIAHTVAKGASEPVALTNSFKLNFSLASMPAFVGSAHLDTIKAINQTCLPLTNFTAAYEADLNNPGQQPNGPFDGRFSAFASVPSFDFHTMLCTYGIELDADTAIVLLEEFESPKEHPDVIKTFTSSPKDMLACGFVLLNENTEARDLKWRNEKKELLEGILANNQRPEKVKITVRTLNPNGFEAHKTSLKKSKDVPLEKRDDLMDEIESWPIYAVLELVAQSAAAPPDDDPDDSDLDDAEDAAPPPPPSKKKKAGGPAAGESAKKMGKTKA